MTKRKVIKKSPSFIIWYTPKLEYQNCPDIRKGWRSMDDDTSAAYETRAEALEAIRKSVANFPEYSRSQFSVRKVTGQ